jgi:aspartyl-tRNA synthetase
VLGNPKVDLGGLELLIPSRVEAANRVEAPLPIGEHTGPDRRLDWRPLDVRLRPEARLVFEVQTTVEKAMRELGYFGRSAYLAQSPQFFKQMAIAVGIDRVLEIAPTWTPLKSKCFPM